MALSPVAPRAARLAPPRISAPPTRRRAVSVLVMLLVCTLLGHRTEALALLHAAVASPWGRTAEGGPTYLWQVARLHLETISASAQ